MRGYKVPTSVNSDHTLNMQDLKKAKGFSGSTGTCSQEVQTLQVKQEVRKVNVTQLEVLVVSQDQDDIWTDVASVSLEAGLQALAQQRLDVAECHQDQQEEESSASHDLWPLTSLSVQTSVFFSSRINVWWTNRSLGQLLGSIGGCLTDWWSMDPISLLGQL